MHPVLARLGLARRRELIANPLFAPLPEDRRVQLLDAVLKVRAGLDHQDTLADDPAARSANAAELKVAITKTLGILDGPLGSDIVEGLWAYYPEAFYDTNPWAHPPDPFYDAEHEEHVCKETLRRMLWVVENLNSEPQDVRLKRKASEASALRAVLLLRFGIKVTMATPSPVRPNHGLDLIGLLADPPNTGDGILKHLKRKSLRR